MVVGLALSAALLIGISDFFSTLAARRGRVLAVTLWVIVISTIPLALIAVIVGGEPDGSDLLFGAAAGLGGGLGLLALFAGYARTSIGIVGPIAAVIGVVLPVTVGIATGDEAGALALVGIVIGAVGIGLIGWRPDTGGRHSRGAAVGYGLAAGVGVGVMATFLGLTQESAKLLPVIPTRLVSAAIVLAVASIRKAPIMPLPASWRYLPGSVIPGSVGILLWITAAQRNLTISGLLLQMLYAVSAILAILFLKERSSPLQRVGFAAAAVAVALVSVG